MTALQEGTAIAVWLLLPPCPLALVAYKVLSTGALSSSSLIREWQMAFLLMMKPRLTCPGPMNCWRQRKLHNNLVATSADRIVPHHPRTVDGSEWMLPPAGLGVVLSGASFSAFLA